MINIAEFGLKEKPFAHLPTDASTQHWAGMDKAKKGMEEIIVSVQPDDIGDQEFVIMHGTLGGGKTHALRYFSQYIAKEGYGYAFLCAKSVWPPHRASGACFSLLSMRTNRCCPTS